MNITQLHHFVFYTMAGLNPFLFIKNKLLFISYPTLKECSAFLSEGNAANPVGCDSPLQIEMAVWRPFCLSSNFLGGVLQPSADNNGAPKGHYYLQRAVTPNQITQQNSVQKAGAPSRQKRNFES
jgi:hypothetical protein